MYELNKEQIRVTYVINRSRLSIGKISNLNKLKLMGLQKNLNNKIQYNNVLITYSFKGIIIKYLNNYLTYHNFVDFAKENKKDKNISLVTQRN